MEGLERFLKAQETSYEHALDEIKAGHKKSHWMWYIFPQIKGLGYSEISKYYAIRDRAEADAYISQPVLRARLLEISGELLKLDSSDAAFVMGKPDDVKLKSSMTLFALVSEIPVFQQVLDKFFDGQRDEMTVQKVGHIQK